MIVFLFFSSYSKCLPNRIQLVKENESIIGFSQLHVPENNAASCDEEQIEDNGDEKEFQEEREGIQNTLNEELTSFLGNMV